MSCADCGCVVDRSVRLVRCDDPTCCCSALPIESPRAFCDRVVRALDSADLEAMGRLLAPGARWGAPEQSVPECRTREEILTWYRGGYDLGTRAEVVSSEIFGDRIILGLEVTGPSRWSTQDPDRPRWQVLTFGNGRITSICGYGSRAEAESSLSSPPIWQPSPS